MVQLLTATCQQVVIFHTIGERPRNDSVGCSLHRFLPVEYRHGSPANSKNRSATPYSFCFVVLHTCRFHRDPGYSDLSTSVRPPHASVHLLATASALFLQKVLYQTSAEHARRNTYEIGLPDKQDCGRKSPTLDFGIDA